MRVRPLLHSLAWPFTLCALALIVRRQIVDDPDVDPETASVSPRSAILARHDEVIGQLTQAVAERVGGQLDVQSAGELIEHTERNGLIDSGTRQALLGITAMRNLAALGPHREIDAKGSQIP